MIKLNSSWPSYTQEEANKVSEIILSNKVNYWTGTEGRKFEKEFARFAETDYAVAVANGTVALDLALHALEIGDGDEVIVTPRTFIASISSIVNCGAIPIFADVDTDSQNITPESIRMVLTPNTKAIICVHLAGWPCQMDDIMAFACDKGLKVIEDCAQAHGAKYLGRSVGSFGHIGAWSFCQDKIMTTGGEGGMVTTNDEKLWEKMWSYKDHGKSFDAVYNRDHPPGFRWLHESFGTNWRLTEMQSAIGRIQLAKMREWTKKRASNATKLKAVFNNYDFLYIPETPQDIWHANYKFYTFVNSKKLPTNWSRDRILEELNKVGVFAMQGSCSEVYMEKAFEGTNFLPAKRLKKAKELGETSIMLQVHPTLEFEEMREICDGITRVLDSVNIT